MAETKMNLYQKLQAIQSELKAPKGQFNKFGNYKYRNCEDILEAVKPILTKVKATIIVGDELLLIGDRYYVKAVARLVDTETEASIENTAYAREEESKKGMDSSQVTGAASSYARKYALNGLLCIDDTKDSDTTNTHGKEEPAKTGQKTGKPTEDKPKDDKSANSAYITEEQFNTLQDMMKQAGVEDKKFCTAFKIESLMVLPVDKYESAVKKLKITIEAKEKKNEQSGT